MRNAALPVTLIVLGALGLVWYFGWFPDFDALTSIGFIAGGVLVLAMDGITKSSIVLGPTLIAVGIAWWLHDQQHLRLQPPRLGAADRDRRSDARCAEPAHSGAAPATRAVLTDAPRGQRRRQSGMRRLRDPDGAPMQAMPSPAARPPRKRR